MLLATAALILWLIGYVALFLVQPFARCRRCAGTGERVRGRSVRTCPRCCGDRYRLRLGRRLHNAWRRTYEAGTRQPTRRRTP
ncbi:hypothetical protein [Streptomyces albicerus]|uniref:hypothetical protein n=1 Tax=Streptomyces albicerus TaxID=2569859 RepID=UPI00124B37F4|nr:hypothetical protein [Streptomyces albicerus]